MQRAARRPASSCSAAPSAPDLSASARRGRPQRGRRADDRRPELARKYPDARIIFCGGDRRLCSIGAAAKPRSRRLFESLGVPRERRHRSKTGRATPSRTPSIPRRWPARSRASAGSWSPRRSHAARDRRLSRGRISGRGLSGRLPHQRLAGRSRPVGEPLGEDCAAPTPRSTNGSGFSPIGSPGRSSALFPGP